MNNIERETLVERYLNGELSGSQEQDFFIKVAVDNELRRTLRAYMIVSSAFRVDRDGVPTERPAMRARVMATLAASTVEQTATTGSSGLVGSSGGAMVSTATTWTSALWKWMMAAATTAALGVGGYLVGTQYFDRETAVQSEDNAQSPTEMRDRQQTTPLPPALIESPTSAPEMRTESSDAVKTTSDAAISNRGTRPSETLLHAAPERRATSNRGSQEAAPASAQSPNAEPNANKPDAAIDGVPLKDTQPNPVLSDEDTMRFKTRINTDGMKRKP